MLWGGLGEEESPDAHGWVLDVACLEHTVEMAADPLEVELAVGVLGLVEHDETEYIILDAVPHRGVIGVGAFEESLDG